MHRYRMLIGGELSASGSALDIRNPFTGEVSARAPLAGEADVEAALSAAAGARQVMRELPAYERSALLLRLRDRVRERGEELARAITQEAGKPIRDARVEVDRALNTLTLASEEAKRIGGEVLPLDLAASSAGRFGITRRFPVGPVAGITPFNFPLNLGMHKVAPAIAAGCPLIWKPPLQAPGAAFLFGEIAAECGLPPGALAVVLPPNELAERLVTDPRIRMLSFTGSAAVGWKLRSLAGSKKVALELGGNAAVIVGADADTAHAARRCAAGGFAYSGQVCISVQRIMVEAPVYQPFLEQLVSAVLALKAGDPMDEGTQVGPMVSDAEAGRVEAWLAEALAGGARALCGGGRQGRYIEPTVLVNTRPEMKVSCEEVFGPVVTVSPFEQWNEALAAVNDSRYGLQAGIFTRDLDRVLAAFRELEVGGVIVNDVPTYRMDSMPYGGIKDSGLGREGVRYAIEDMTEPRLLALGA